MLSSTGWVQSIVIFRVSFFFFKAAPLPLNVAFGFFWVELAFLVNVSFTGAPGAFFNVGATVFLTVTAAVKVFFGGAAGVAGFLSETSFFSSVFFAATGTFLAVSISFLTTFTGSGFFSTLAGSFLSFFVGLGSSSAARFVALALGSSLTFLGSSFFPLVCGATCCWPFLVCFTSGSLTFGFSGSAFFALGSALTDLGFSFTGSGLAFDLDGCCEAGLVDFLALSFLLSTTFFCTGALK